jgi:hypothetical protein
VTNAKQERDAAAEPASASPTEDVRNQAQSLFELDTPSLQPAGAAAAVSGGAPANSNATQSASAQQAAESALLAESDANALDEELLALADSPALPDSDAAALTAEELFATQAAASSNVSTRAATHVPDVERFDGLLEPSPTGEAATDTRLRLSWRFKATSTAYRLLSPLCPTPDRQELVALLRKYELSLRAAAGTRPAGTKQLTDALHLALPDELTDELERALAKVEDKLLAIDESVADEAFRMRWNKQRETPKTLLRYARLLACRRFNIGYRRDRFEALAQELLTAKTAAGTLLLMPRAKAAPVLRQLLRGLPRSASTGEERAAASTYLREALDRLQSLSGAKQFFDSGFFLDAHGYKVSMHDHVGNPEFLYLCVALNVEIHNRFLAWSRSEQARGSTPPLAALQAQLRAQEQAVQGVFTNFRKPRDQAAAAGAPSAPVPRKPLKAQATRKSFTSTGVGLFGFVAVCLFVLVGLGANLFAMGVVSLHEPPVPLAQPELAKLSPLLVQGKLSAKGARFDGLLSRRAWQALAPGERRAAAQLLAKNLEQLGIHHAQVFAYQTRAIEVEFGGVAYVDDAK